MSVLDRFLKYVSFDTQSDEDSFSSPSTQKQLLLLDELERELRSLSIPTRRSSCGYVFATLPSNVPNAPKLALIAHVDTSPAVSGADIKPQIINYKGGNLLLNRDRGIVFEEASYPEIKEYIGQDIVFTDGTTLLGADDKAGVAEIMSVLEYYVNNPSVPRAELRIAFTHDEEVGRGTESFCVSDFGADFGYTVDGGKLGELNYESFNAAAGRVKVIGVSVHPGDGFEKMINATDVFAEFHSLLPTSERPCSTRGYEGFYMAEEVKGGIEELNAKYIIRDHNRERFEGRKRFFHDCGAKINEKYGKIVIEISTEDSYYNMREVIEKHFHLVITAKDAFCKQGVTADLVPIRGGTDGSRLSFEGLPCPNLSTGGLNFHGRFEYIPVKSLEIMVEVIKNICERYSKFDA